MDAESQSRDLANKILSSSTPSQILSVCKSISKHLQSCPTDQSRHFFSVAFPVLISKFFGYSAFSASNASPMALDTAGWINVANQANDANLISGLLALLSPSGILFQSIFSADRLSLVEYFFPSERLPEWIRYMLSNDKYFHTLPYLCPLFGERLKATSQKSSCSNRVQLSIFEYFVFWFAYYPICKGSSGSSTTVSAKRSKRFRLENWAISRLSNSKGERSKCVSNLYHLLLDAYLKKFVPLDEAPAHLQGNPGSLLHYDNDESGWFIQDRAAFFVESLVNYWLIDNDPSPIPANIAKCRGILTSFRLETPPSSNTGEFVKMLVEYVLLCPVVTIDTTYQRHNLMPVSINNRTLQSPWNSSFQRGVYRYILRTLLYFPIGDSLENVSEVFSVWISYLEPWKIERDELFEQDPLNPSNHSVYSHLWEPYVLSSYLFYTSLLMHFVQFSLKFLNSDKNTILRMVITIVDVLCCNNELTNLLKDVNIYLSSKLPGSSDCNLQKHLPLIREQLLDWEDGLSGNNPNPNLFTDNEDGGHKLFQRFILRAEAVIPTTPGDNLHLLDSLKSKIIQLFSVRSPEPEPQTKKQEQPKGELFTPRKFRTSFVSDNSGNMNPMQRPFRESEIKWLAKVLVRLSCWVNDLVGLNHAVVIDSTQKVSFVELTTNCGDVYGVKGVLKVIFNGLLDWLRVHGVRVNLRMLASKRLIFLCFVLIFLRTVFLVISV